MSVTLHTTLGDIKVEIFCESVPKTAENFLALCAIGYYKGTKVHRLYKDFMFQMGIPDQSNPIFKQSVGLKWEKGGQSIYKLAEPEQPFFENEIRPGLRHNARGILSMANRGPKHPNTNGSQFFITLAPTPYLDGDSTVFGHVLEGMDVVDEIEKIEAVKGKPKQEVRIERVTIHANPLADR